MTSSESASFEIIASVSASVAQTLDVMVIIMQMPSMLTGR
jgi:hypothetical protein